MVSHAIQFQLDLDGDDDCNYDEAFFDNNAAYSNNNVVDSDAGLSNASSVLEEGVFEVTIVPGTQLTPYSTITAASHCEAVGQSVEPSSVLRIDPVHEKWKHQSMLDDWGILYQHEFPALSPIFCLTVVSSVSALLSIVHRLLSGIDVCGCIIVDCFVPCRLHRGVVVRVVLVVCFVARCLHRCRGFGGKMTIFSNGSYDQCKYPDPLIYTPI